MHPLRRLFGYARAYRRNAVLGTVYSVLNKIFDVLPELLIGVAIDVVVNREASFIARFGIVDPMQQLIALTVLTVVIWVAESLFEYLLALKWRGLAQDLQHELRLDAYAHLQQQPPAAISEARSGRLMAVLNEDVNQVERFLNTGANELIQVVVGSAIVGVFFFAMTASLAALALLPVPLILIGAFWFQKRLQPRYAAAREAAATVSARLDNNLAGMATIQAYTAEDAELEHVRRASDDYRQANAEAIRFAAAITPVIRMAVLAGFAVTLLYGGWLTLEGELGAGSYAALVYLTQRLLWPLTRLAEMTDLYNRSMASVQRVMDLLESPLPRRPAGRIEDRPVGALAFEHVRHAYRGHVALEDVSFRIGPGQTVALVGATGAGKSTLLKRLMGFLDAQSGRITLDGRDLAEIDPRSLRGHLGYVAQEPFLTDGTVAENIAYGAVASGNAVPDAARIEAAARAAEAHDFIAELPGGYSAEVGERGARLSGGQRQRIALARALYRDPAVLVLDEATSAIDNETEAAIQRSLATHAKGRSTLVVAHRLSTVRHADAIHVLEHGRIVESGTHDELVARDGAYAALWRLQTGEASASPASGLTR